MHGGSIGARSDGFGHGSTFTVTLPRHAAERHAPPSPQRDDQVRERLRSVRVLLVEDDDPTRTLLAAILSSFGAEVTDASSVERAETMVEACDPQILITDIEMPGSDGIALLQRLRDGRHRTLPAIAVTGYADAVNRERILAAGFNGFVAKPLDPTVLADEIVRALGS